MKPCLLIIDLQNDFLASLDTSVVTSLVANTNHLVRTFRAETLPIVWIRQEFRADLSDAFLEMRDKNIAGVIEGTEGAQLHPDLEASENDVTIIKKRYSAFFGTTLDQYLQEQKVDHLVLCGINTHACIRTAAIDAYQRDYRVLLPRECIGSYDDEHARVTLLYLDRKIGRVVVVEDVVEMVRDNECPTRFQEVDLDRAMEL
ncbi:nicotinamidase-related amidase [Rhizobium rosettiformans]|uniref:Cysteine hydrolase n=2 Tax=Rhizobium rosettiformans TaxID=1368430 RepID=A0A4S8PZF1_9HYPH|nr:isochorismatase family cysteine hydrolase [Rhizobium rosettiformans]MBB5276733.1 nicotinamidase-related amidase [Rhizobium rosettiformans]THV35422.1 cysteine hydrolase [Rhizobium rosettiformans W3]